MIKPYKDQPGSRKEQVKQMFDGIAPRYNFLNHLLSFNIDRSWRRKLVKTSIRDLEAAGRLTAASILDVATGTGDLAFEFAKYHPGEITGLDLSPGMLEIAKKKAERNMLKIKFICGDSENLPFPDSTFDIVSVAFGVRNFADLEKGLEEFLRVLKPGGRACILEFSVPGNRFFRFAYRLYSNHLLPFLAGLFSSDRRAYQYLPESIALFPSGNNFLEVAKIAGFSKSVWKPLTGGIASIYLLNKNLQQDYVS